MKSDDEICLMKFVWWNLFDAIFDETTVLLMWNDMMVIDWTEF